MTTVTPTSNDIRPIAIEEEMKRSYLDYAMSVIVSRALPDIRDGLKPVHRRILYAMKEAGNEYNKPYRKSARVVGDVMGKYHPHGNAPIYEAMVRLTQDFNLRLPLIDGQGNFGSMDGDSPAAERYTEARLSKASHELLVDIDKETVDYHANYDDSLEEPSVLPARFPNLLVNGTNGISVGMATYIPTHNLGEIIDACCALIEKPELDIYELLQYVPGPDFPTGGIIQGKSGIIEAFKKGRGGVVVRARTHIEPISSNREAIIVTEVPFQVNKARLVEKIAALVREKVIEGIGDLRDESDRDGVRVVIELKRDVLADVVLNQLYKHTPLQTNINYNMLALHKGRPEQLSLKRILEAFIEFREEVIVRRTRYDLRKARERAHALAGFAVAVANIDEVIGLIRSSKDRVEARENLLSRSWNATSIEPILKIVSPHIEEFELYHLSEDQANAILDLRLHRLTGLERDKIQNELNEVCASIQEYLSILASREKVLQIMKDELQNIKEEFATPRKTDIEDTGSVFDMEDLIQPEDMVVTISLGGYIKRVPLSSYRAQRRGGKGKTGMNIHDEDAVSQVIVANTHDQILFFSSFGRVYAMKTYRLPIATPQSKGRSLVNLLPFGESEQISAILVLKKDEIQLKGEVLEEIDTNYLMFSTSRGNVRRNRLTDFSNIPSNGKKAIVLDEGETLVGVKLFSSHQDILLSTHNGVTNRFSVGDVRVFAGRDSNGVRGIRLKDDDYVVSIAVVEGVIAEDINERDAYLSESYRRRRLLNPSLEEDESDAPEVESFENLSISDERFQALSNAEQFVLTITEKGFGKITSLYEYRKTNRGSSGYVGIQLDKRNDKVIRSFPVEKNDEIFMISTDGQVLRCGVERIRTTGRRSQGVIVFRLPQGELISSVYCIASQGLEDLAINKEEE